MANQKLTDREEKATISAEALIHIVEPNDFSQSPEGSSYKFKASNLPDATQDNIDIVKRIKIASTETISEILVKINNLPTYIVNEVKSVWVVARSTPSLPNQPYVPQRVVKFKVVNVGKGTYGNGGVQLTTNNIELISDNIESVLDIESDPTTDIINYGALTGQTVSQWLNLKNPAIAIQPQTDGYTLFKGSVDGDDITYLWIGDAGVYGVGETMSTMADFQEVSEELPEPVEPDNYLKLTGETSQSVDGIVNFDKITQTDAPVNGIDVVNKTYSDIPASPTTAGKTKLYTSTGSSTDGTMDRNSITVALGTKQDTLVSGTTLKTVGGVSLLGSGNVTEVQNNMTPSTTLAPSVTAANTALAAKANDNDVVHLNPAGAETRTGNLTNVGIITISDPTGGVNLRLNRGTGGVYFGTATNTDALYLYNKAGTLTYTMWDTSGNMTVLGTVTHAAATLGTHSATLNQVNAKVQNNLTASTTVAPSATAVNTALALKQDSLVSGTNIKTINGTTLLGSGNITLAGQTVLLLSSQTFAAPSLAVGATHVVSYALTGAAVGDFINIADLTTTTGINLIFTARCVSANNIEVTAFNPTSGSVGAWNYTLSFRIIK